MTIYRVSVNYKFGGNTWVNNFYYRLGVGVPPESIPWFGFQPVAEEFTQEVLPKIRGCMGNWAGVTHLTVDGYGDDGLPLATFPYVHQLGYLPGTGSLGPQMLGPQMCVVLRANLESELRTMFQTSFLRRSYVYFGGLSEAMVVDGALEQSWYEPETSAFRQLVNALSQNLEGIDPPAVYYPVRARFAKVLGVVKVVQYVDILNWAVSPLVRELKRRRPG